MADEKRRVGVIICGHVRDELVADHGEYGEFFARVLADDRLTFQDYFAVDGELPARVDACDAYVFSGSAHGAYEDHAFIPPLEAFIKEAFAAKIPLLGVCFGHQIMAQALGGKVEKFNGGWGLGVHDYQIKGGDWPSSDTVKLNAVHQDQVVEVPPGATVTATSDFCKNAALAYGDQAISIQPHPEFDRDFMEDLIDLRRGQSFSDDVADKALGTLDQKTDNAPVRAAMRAFLTRGL